jgi:hypothetical protein
MSNQEQILHGRVVVFVARIESVKLSCNGYIDCSNMTELKIVLEYDNGSIVAFAIDDVNATPTFFDECCTEIISIYKNQVIEKMGACLPMTSLEYFFMHNELSRQAK